MGTVYEGLQIDLRRRVAVKVLHASAAHGDGLVRFRREAEAAAALRNTHIVQVSDFQANGVEPPFLVMELLEGRSLAEVLDREGRVEPGRVARIARQVLSALGSAHAAGIVHRDIKPENIFLCPSPSVGELVKLVDFGIAKLARDGVDPLTRDGLVIGSVLYMSPEQAAGANTDGRSDIFSLAACMYHALTGQLPFPGNNAVAVLRALAVGRVTPLSTAAPHVHPGLAEIVHRALSPDAMHRYQDAAQMAYAIDRWLTDMGMALSGMFAPLDAPVTMPNPEVMLTQSGSVPAGVPRVSASFGTNPTVAHALTPTGGAAIVNPPFGTPHGGAARLSGMPGMSGPPGSQGYASTPPGYPGGAAPAYPPQSPYAPPTLASGAPMALQYGSLPPGAPAQSMLPSPSAPRRRWWPIAAALFGVLGLGAAVIAVVYVVTHDAQPGALFDASPADAQLATVAPTDAALDAAPDVRDAASDSASPPPVAPRTVDGGARFTPSDAGPPRLDGGVSRTDAGAPASGKVPCKTHADCSRFASCDAGYCRCMGAQCGDLCFSPMDVRNCGGCGIVCDKDEVCDEGPMREPFKCRPCKKSKFAHPGNPLDYCGDRGPNQCNMLNNDPRNCGSCGNKCLATQKCVAGKCI
jgi:serine/threonine-protein kinase